MLSFGGSKPSNSILTEESRRPSHFPSMNHYPGLLKSSRSITRARSVKWVRCSKSRNGAQMHVMQAMTGKDAVIARRAASEIQDTLQTPTLFSNARTNQHINFSPPDRIMSLTATLRQTSMATSSGTETAFHLQPDYITLHRMLIRYQHNILLVPPSDVLSSFQKEVQKDLRSPLPYHRTKWLHNIEYARTLLLQLEHAAQGIRIQRSKRDAIRDLAEKRTIVKKLRNRVEELGRAPEIMSEEAWDADGQSETLDKLLGRPVSSDHDDILSNGNPVTSTKQQEFPTPVIPQSDKDALFGPRNRRSNKNDEALNHPTATTSGFSNLESTEKTLLADSRTQEDLTTSLVSMAAQLKQQARAFQGSLELDKGLLDRALEGLDRNVSGMAAASKNMQFLRRMSEGQGWWGRMKLYALIFAGWVLLILMVFVGPKLRF